LRPKSFVALIVLLAVVWPGVAATAAKKKPVAKRPVVAVKKRVAAKRSVASKRRAPVKTVASQPKKFVTVPVVTELKACSLKEHRSGGPVLCLNCAEQALSTAHAFTGLKYKRGGTNPNVGFDCSGFVRHVFLNSCGRELPRTAREQFALGDAVERESLEKGDLVFFAGRQGWHVGIFTGNNAFIHSPNRRDSIKVSSLDEPYWKSRYKGARRLTTEIAPMVAADTAAIPTN
jgi:cell wall-associated NlpC family hydrolase